MPKGKCVFSEKWLDDHTYSACLEKWRTDKSLAYCKLWKKSFDVLSMVSLSLTSHGKGMKHTSLALTLLKTPTTSAFLSTGGSATSQSSSPRPVSCCLFDRQPQPQKVEGSPLLLLAASGFPGSTTVYKLITSKFIVFHRCFKHRVLDKFSWETLESHGVESWNILDF